MRRYVLGRVSAAKPLYVETPLWEAPPHYLPSLTVDSHDVVDTGLIALTGEPIMRVPEPMGFHRAEGVRD